MAVVIDEEKCAECGICVKIEEGKVIVSDECGECEICVDKCPN